MFMYFPLYVLCLNYCLGVAGKGRDSFSFVEVFQVPLSQV